MMSPDREHLHSRRKEASNLGYPRNTTFSKRMTLAGRRLLVFESYIHLLYSNQHLVLMIRMPMCSIACIELS